MGIDKASMVKFLDDLESKGLTERTESPEDRRIKLISLTPAGNKLLKKALALGAEIEESFLSQKLSPKEAQTLKDLIKKALS